MGPLEELKLHIDALALAVDANPKFFASVRHYVAQLQQLLNGRKNPTVAELQVPISKLEEFWAQWRRTSGGGFYIPPRETGDTDSTVQRMQALLGDLATLNESEFQKLAERVVQTVEGVGISPKDPVKQPCVFIGHGRNRPWARVKMYLEDEVGLATVAYESESRTGDSIVPVLEKMLDQATFAVLILQPRMRESQVESGPGRMSFMKRGYFRVGSDSSVPFC